MVEVPEPPVIELGDRPHDRFVELVVAVSATVAVNPFRGATDIVELPETLTSVETLVGIAVIVKS
jgi:hypothetical protein